MDGYAGYHKVKHATLLGCWAHARRVLRMRLRRCRRE
ncbi:IS66 family transposase [Paenibacillus popilliae]|nr:transposase [Paenibacillus popilliae]